MLYITNNKIRNSFYQAGLDNDQAEFSRFIVLYKITGHAVREANEIFAEGRNYKAPVDLTSKEALKAIMTRAWEIARMSVQMWGGKVKEFFKESLRLAWLEVKFA